MDTGVERGTAQRVDEPDEDRPDVVRDAAADGPAAAEGAAADGAAAADAAPPPGVTGGPTWDDVPTTILDLRTAFAEAGPRDAAPLGVVTVEREHPGRAGLAFVAVLVLIATVAGGIVLGLASVGRAAYEQLSAPPQCSARQVADGVALEGWLRDLVTPAAKKAVVTRTGCVSEGVTDPLTGQAAETTVPSASIRPMLPGFRKVDCRLTPANGLSARFCTVSIDGRLAQLEYRLAKDRRTVKLSVNFR